MNYIYAICITTTTTTKFLNEITYFVNIIVYFDFVKNIAVAVLFLYVLLTVVYNFVYPLW
jgi:hypothetical protein